MMVADISASEQLLLELVNRARLDPRGEAARYGINLNADLPVGTLNGTARQPLAPNELLTGAARNHSQWMINSDTFSHFGTGHSDPGDRIQAAGYAFIDVWNWGENIAWRGTTGIPNLGSFTLQLHKDLFLSPDHRFNLLKEEFRELGAGISSGRFTSDGHTYNAVLATQNFARSGPDPFITGVAILDRDQDLFYDIGEAHTGVVVTVEQNGSQQGSDTTASAGGYSVAFAGGTADVVFSAGGLPADVIVTISAGQQNTKVDLVNTNTILSSATAALGEGAVRLVLLGSANINGSGNDQSNTIRGNSGANVISGGDGNDILCGGKGRDVLVGGAGQDRFDFNSCLDTAKSAVLRDRITDFEQGVDRIDLCSIDARSNVAGNQCFKWIGSQNFHDRAGELRFVQFGSDIIILGDVDGDGRADFQIEIDKIAGISRADFIL